MEPSINPMLAQALMAEHQRELTRTFRAVRRHTDTPRRRFLHRRSEPRR